ncbi:sensor histidine kinase [Neobacillus bataviensis]|uniref:sensor histidine kinase n=1 Tax=Neobacillus bataviensis TaxID=220685 RepID=UPI001CBDC297|nr:ATP-binding protein [Neobacillus bataviensis]
MKLSSKINLSTAVLFAFLLIVMNFSVYISFSKLLLDSEIDTANRELKKTADAIGQSLGTVPDLDLLRSYVPIDGMIRFVPKGNQRIISVTSSTENKLKERNTKFSKTEISQFIEFQNQSYIFESMPIIMSDGNEGNLQIIKSIKTTTNNLKILRLVLILVTFLALVPVIVSSRILSKLITRPVTTMIKTMTEIRQSGRFKRLILEEKSKDELYQMGKTFNHMIDLLETNYEKQKMFVSNASHEFKTPLTIIESYSSLLKRRGLADPQIFNESIEAIHSEAIRMKDMTDQLLLLAKHHEQWNIQKTEINLTSFLKQSLITFRNAYNLDIHYADENDSEPPLTVLTDEKKLKQLLFIFLDNARKYSDDTIKVALGIMDGEVYIKIMDRGIGMSTEDLTKVFDRFYRVDKARNRKKGGAGLGLSLAKEIADAIDVRLQLESKEGVGTTAALFLKK